MSPNLSPIDHLDPTRPAGQVKNRDTRRLCYEMAQHNDCVILSGRTYFLTVTVFFLVFFGYFRQ